MVPNSRFYRIKPVQQRYVAGRQLAGGVMLVARRGKVVMLDTFGAMDTESGKPMPIDAIFRTRCRAFPE